MKRTGRLSPMSEKRRQELGGNPTSTFAPRKPAMVQGSAAKPERPVSTFRKTRPQPAVPVDVRDALRDRAGEGEWCEAQLEGCQGQGIDPHHRITRGAGGRHGVAKERSDRMSALLLLCRSCHRWAHEHPAAAEPLGLLLPQSTIPAQVPVLYRGEPKYLSDDGRVWALEEVGA